MSPIANAILEELQELAKSGELPQNVSNRLLLAGIIKNTEQISSLVEFGQINERKIAVLEKVTAILSTLVLALFGWTIFG